MSLPPGFLDELRTRLTLSDVVGRKVMWDTRKSNQARGDYWSPCPFHQEKTASFHVDDRKGFYYCFGCHAKGDAINFVQETENTGFMEAVEILAGEAGMPMPARDPKAREQADRRSLLAEAMDAAVRHYRMQLSTQGAARARDYLTGRGLQGKALERFEIGFAPDQRQGLFSALTERGIAADVVIEAGLCAKPDDGGAPYDRFRDRIIFPIRDARGRCIGLGGRAMSPKARAKYLNSPETPLFDKGRSLYNHGPAREAAGKGQPLIVAEGYMDVIALVKAGFGAAVAPLGTAVTEEQLRLLWRIAPEPVVALDGDTAGIRAALRLMNLALPLIEAGQSLRFCIMPEGKDPDDLIRDGGPEAMQAALEKAEPMVDLLWRQETDGKVLDSPERRAAFDKSLREAVRRIKDTTIRRHYTDELDRRRRALFNMPERDTSAPQPAFRPEGGGYDDGYGRDDGGRDYGYDSNSYGGDYGGGFGNGPKKGRSGFAGRGPGSRPGSGRGNRGRGGWLDRMAAAPTPGAKASILAAEAGSVTEHLREAVILATFLHHPDLIDDFAHVLEETSFTGPGHARIAATLLRVGDGAADPVGLRQAMEAEIGAAPLETLLAPRHVQLAPPMRRVRDGELARMCLAEELAKLAAQRGAAREIAEAVTEIDGLADEGLTWRLGQAAEAQHRAIRPMDNDKADFDIAPNGTRMDKEERSALDRLLDQIEFAKPGGKPGPKPGGDGTS
ncbi:MAG: DNA primase [Celeribacter sp.]